MISSEGVAYPKNIGKCAISYHFPAYLLISIESTATGLVLVSAKVLKGSIKLTAARKQKRAIMKLLFKSLVISSSLAAVSLMLPLSTFAEVCSCIGYTITLKKHR
jgi:hypothetical protein